MKGLYLHGPPEVGMTDMLLQLMTVMGRDLHDPPLFIGHGVAYCGVSGGFVSEVH